MQFYTPTKKVEQNSSKEKLFEKQKNNNQMMPTIKEERFAI